MMELNREQIIKMLETIDEVGDCSRDCIFYNGKVHSCGGTIAKHALALIKELTEESQKWEQAYDCSDSACRELSSKCDELTEKKEEYCRECAELRVVLYEITDEVNQIKADAVRKMQKLFEERLDISVCGYSTEEVVGDVLETLDRVVTEVLEENNV